MNNKAFTLIELIVTFLIASIIAFAAVAQFSSNQAIVLSAAAQKIAADIRYAQRLVMNRDSAAAYGSTGAYKIVVDFENASNNIYSLKSYPQTIITDPISGQPWQVNIGTEFRGVSIYDVDLGPGGYPDVYFQSPLADAKACIWIGSDCTIPSELYTAGGTVILRAGSRLKTIRIFPVTGRVEIE